MKPIITPIEKKVLLGELTKEKFVRNTNYSNNKIYIITHHDSPNIIREIGRLRELTFRTAGGGTGLDCDLDNFDTDTICYKQLIVWNPENEEIVGGYRFMFLRDAKKDEKGNLHLSTSHYFHFSEKFLTEFAPYTIELGRSFIQPQYQPSECNRKGLFSLDNLWDGLGAISVDNPDIKYFFGKVTMYMDFNRQARDMILYFLNFFFSDTDKLVQPHHPVSYETDISKFKTFFTKDMSYKDAYLILNQNVRKMGENIPPLINSYMNLSPTMKTFGTSINKEFGNVEETGIMINISNIYQSKKERHIVSYEKKNRFF
ncbi:MAG: GNAT family N-acyltransferase [Bacteroidota bacterium]